MPSISDPTTLLKRAASLQLSPYVPWAPTPHQTAFLMLDTLEALYGGAAGGAKTVALLMAALQYVHVPGYNALLLRRTFPDLYQPKGLIPLSKDWLSGKGPRWTAHNQWVFPSGAVLQFGYLQHEDDKYRYQGSEYLFCGFDELTEFYESQYRYLFSRLRKPIGLDVPLRMRCASNPGGVGHDWVRQRFVDGGREEGRVFLPAKLKDNPHLDQAEYTRAMMNLDPVTRQQLLEGDWSARQGGSLFRREWFEVVDAEPAGLRKLRYWDLASTEATKGKDPDYTAGLLLGIGASGVYYVLDVARVRATPARVEALIKQKAELDGKAAPIWIEQEPGSSGVNTIDHYVRRVLSGWAVRGQRSTGSKVERANPVSSQAEAGNIKLVRGPWIGAFLDELEAFPNGSHDDQVDALSGALNLLAGKGQPTLRFL